MTTASRVASLGVVAFLLLAERGDAQFRENIEVRLHNIDVVVETRAGEPVTGLKREDFIVKQDGAPQTITHFAVNAAGAAPQGVNVGEVAVREARRFVFFLDEAGLNDLARNDLMNQATTLVNQMEPMDEVMIVAAAATRQIPLFFTSDKKRALITMDRVIGQMMRLYNQERVGDQTKPKIAMMIDIGEDTQTEFVFRRGECSGINCSEQRLKMLKTVLEGLARVPGRKIMFVLTNRITSVPDWNLKTSPVPAGGGSTIANLRREAILDHGKNLQPVVDEVARVAAGSNVTVYGLEPFEAGEVAMGGISAERSGQIAPQAAATRGLPGAFDVLADLARITGGRAYSGGSKDFGKMFQQVSSDLNASYSLAFADKPGRKPGHSVEVSIKGRPELVVRARRHVVSQPENVEFQQRAVGALLTSSPENPLGISMTLAPLVKQGNFVDIPITVSVPLDKLTITRQGDAYRGSFDVYVAVAAGDKVDFRNAHQKNTQIISIPAADWDGAKNQVFQYASTVRLKPGRYRVSIGITDPASGEAGFHTFDVVAR